MSSIKTILYKYVGQDKFNLHFEKKKTHTTHYRNTPNQGNTNQHSNSRQIKRNESGQVRQNFNQVFNQSNQNRLQNNRQNNNFRNSRQYRSGQSRVEPMDVDALSKREDVNQIESHEFFINYPRTVGKYVYN